MPGLFCSHVSRLTSFPSQRLRGNLCQPRFRGVQYGRHSKPHSLQVLLTVLLLVVLVAGYVAAMNALLEVSRIETDSDAADRDTIYAIVHLGLLAAAAIIGFLTGKWLNGLGFAYATLFVFALAVLMVVAQISTYELACQGQNDIIRHWQC